MLFKDIIRKKRDGGELGEAEIAALVTGLVDDSVPSEQISALAMAVYFNGMAFEEAAALTRAMAQSGRVLDWRTLLDGEVAGPIVDKHSTGGVGDKVSFLLAPIAAACGCVLPMISGRALGHTGGTLDKIEAIPGYQNQPDLDLFAKAIKAAGCAIIGQTTDIAPADRRFYAIRDVTGTVESIPLITASILSKKLAAGNQSLVMDVKVGSGAFMATADDAQALARSIIGTGEAAGLTTRALITDMNEVLGQSAGNALEIAESVAYLRGELREPRLDEVVLALAAEMLQMGGIETDLDAARRRAEGALTSGAAAEHFARMVTALGGPADFVDNAGAYLVPAPRSAPVPAPRGGQLAAVDATAIGNAIIALGGGRQVQGQKLDLSVGYSQIVPIGTRVDAGDPLAVAHAADDAGLTAAIAAYNDACRLSDAPVTPAPVMQARLTVADIC